MRALRLVRFLSPTNWSQRDWDSGRRRLRVRDVQAHVLDFLVPNTGRVELSVPLIPFLRWRPRQKIQPATTTDLRVAMPVDLCYKSVHGRGCLGKRRCASRCIMMKSGLHQEKKSLCDVIAVPHLLSPRLVFKIH